MRAAAYARVSSQEQIEGTSLKNQEDQIRAYCTMKGITLAGLFIDAGVSGGKPIAERPEGCRLVDMVDSGEVDCVVIVKLDRAFRNVVDCLTTVTAWEQRNVALHIIDLGGNSIDTTSPAGRFMLTVLSAAGEMERGMIRDRCNSGRAARKAENKRIGELPFGYELGENNRLVENPEEQRILGIIRELRAAGQSLRNIADHLNSEGFRAKKNGAWTHSSVNSVLRRAA